MGFVEIPIKRRHTEYQDIAQSVIYTNSGERRTALLLAAIADRLTDIADNLEVMNNGKRT